MLPRSCPAQDRQGPAHLLFPRDNALFLSALQLVLRFGAGFGVVFIFRALRPTPLRAFFLSLPHKKQMVLGKACNCKICSNYPAEVIGLREALALQAAGGGARRKRGAERRGGSGGALRSAAGCAGAELPGVRELPPG